MALIDAGTIADVTAERLISRDPARVDLIQAQVDDDIVAVVLWTGLKEADIPVDGSGFTTSVVLKRYGRYRLLHYIMETLRHAVENNDSYEKDAIAYDEKSERARVQITDCTILENETVGAADRTGNAGVIY